MWYRCLLIVNDTRKSGWNVLTPLEGRYFCLGAESNDSYCFFGAEIPRPTTVWMYKILKSWDKLYTYQLAGRISEPSTVSHCRLSFVWDLYCFTQIYGHNTTVYTFCGFFMFHDFHVFIFCPPRISKSPHAKKRSSKFPRPKNHDVAAAGVLILVCCSTFSRRRCSASRTWGFRVGFFGVGFSHMGVSENSGTPKSSILIGFSIINHPFWSTPNFWKHPYGTGEMSTKGLRTCRYIAWKCVEYIVIKNRQFIRFKREVFRIHYLCRLGLTCWQQLIHFGSCYQLIIGFRCFYRLGMDQKQKWAIYLGNLL